MSQKFVLLITATTIILIGVKYFTPTATSFTSTSAHTTIVLFIIATTTSTKLIQAMFTTYIAPILIIWRLITYYIHH